MKYWSHHHNPRTVANNPAGEVTIALDIRGPHYCLGAACAAGNVGIVQGMQMLQLGVVDVALGGGVSESIHTFGIFASFKAEGALAEHADPPTASRPFDKNRNGIVVEVAGYGINSDARDFVLPVAERQAECMRLAIKQAGLQPGDIDIVSTHATSTPLGDVQECMAVHEVFEGQPDVLVNNTKSFIGHTMGAAGALELAGNLPSFTDHMVHPTLNVEELDEKCAVNNLVTNEPLKLKSVDYILNNSFGMLGINSSVIVKRYRPGGA